MIRDRINDRDYDIHALRHAATAELAAARYSGERIAAITGHKTTAKIARYAGPVRQRARAKEEQARRGTNAARLGNAESNVKKSS